MLANEDLRSGLIIGERLGSSATSRGCGQEREHLMHGSGLLQDSSMSIVTAIAQGLDRAQQAVITFLNQVQNVNVVVSVAFCN